MHVVVRLRVRLALHSMSREHTEHRHSPTATQVWAKQAVSHGTPAQPLSGNCTRWPTSSRAVTAAVWPLLAACIRGEPPLRGSTSSQSAPNSSSRCTRGTWPCCATSTASCVATSLCRSEFCSTSSSAPGLCSSTTGPAACRRAGRCGLWWLGSSAGAQQVKHRLWLSMQVCRLGLVQWHLQAC